MNRFVKWLIGAVTGIVAFCLLFLRKKQTVIREPDLTEAARDTTKRLNAELVEKYKESDEEVDDYDSTADALNTLYGLGSSSESEGP